MGIAATPLLAVAVLFLSTKCNALTLSANPVRRVVNMLESMQHKIEEEEDSEQKLLNKFLCYCKTGKGSLEKQIADAEAAIPQIQSSIVQLEAESGQIVNALQHAKASREDAKESQAQGKALREKQAAEFAKSSADARTNIEALARAIAALEKGVAGSFLQSSAAATIRSLSVSMDLAPEDRDKLSSFLAIGSQTSYSPQSGEVIGILKQMKDTMTSDLASAVSTEDAAKASFASLEAAKTQEIAALTKEIEEKSQRGGQSAVDLVNLKEDLEDKQNALQEDQTFLADLNKNCATKESEWEQRQKTRAEELQAIHETIRILNNDDALELFKRTLPSPALLQVRVVAAELKKQALSELEGSRRHDVRLSFIALALNDKRGVPLDKVIKMIDEMVALLAEEQATDETKVTYCQSEIDKTEDEAKILDRQIADLDKATEEGKSNLAGVVEELKSLADNIATLDKQVAEATEQRKKENQNFKETFASDKAAVDLLGIAKNRLQLFYNPMLAKPSEAPAAEGAVGFLARDAPASPPETWGEYNKKGQESAGVLALMDSLVADVQKEMRELEVDENHAQKEYEALMEDAAATRKTTAEEIRTKEGVKADLEARLETLRDDTKSATAEAMGKGEALASLHTECDWLVSNFLTRKEARGAEVESLKSAKAVLSGADYSFLQI